ncbi:sugar transferase [Lunatimonas lonarensis]|uniref:Sugar transferase n=1 Tax=Lunatimonas lonarensis TaxID=1232681 RepID=R7ZPB6_9BACT|nr:sugar transferase [Lunatimonas lonarensis]EON75903.1 sugar transferase [Lunatimonas lonarensis]
MAETLIAESQKVNTKKARKRAKILTLAPSKFLNPNQDQLKRVFDVIVSGVLFVVVFSWLFPLIALLIKLDSKGPVFFRQLRHGKNNVPFYCYKFRTMHPNREADFKQATKNDPRVTRLGAILRKTSLDELPQFINVLLGEMSIVGPRPHAMPMNDRFSAEITNFMYRHTVKPGITGLAQAKGFRGETKNFYDIYSRCKLDIFYVDNWSLLLDLKIIVWTAVSLLIKKTEVY